jgi:hypothetical protein
LESAHLLMLRLMMSDAWTLCVSWRSVKLLIYRRAWGSIVLVGLIERALIIEPIMGWWYFMDPVERYHQKPQKMTILVRLYICHTLFYIVFKDWRNWLSWKSFALTEKALIKRRYSYKIVGFEALTISTAVWTTARLCVDITIIFWQVGDKPLFMQNCGKSK